MSFMDMFGVIAFDSRISDFMVCDIISLLYEWIYLTVHLTTHLLKKQGMISFFDQVMLRLKVLVLCVLCIACLYRF